MQLVAKVTIQPGSVPPGETFDVKDKAEAESLIARGLAAPAKAATEKPAPKGGEIKPPAPTGNDGKPPATPGAQA